VFGVVASWHYFEQNCVEFVRAFSNGTVMR